MMSDRGQQEDLNSGAIILRECLKSTFPGDGGDTALWRW